MGSGGIFVLCTSSSIYEHRYVIYFEDRSSDSMLHMQRWCMILIIQNVENIESSFFMPPLLLLLFGGTLHALCMAVL